MNSPFSALSKPYCNYFYVLSIFGYIWLIIALLISLYFFYKSFLSTSSNRKEFTKDFYLSLKSLAMFFILYFQNRLLYSMCSNSLT